MSVYATSLQIIVRNFEQTVDGNKKKLKFIEQIGVLLTDVVEIARCHESLLLGEVIKVYRFIIGNSNYTCNLAKFNFLSIELIAKLKSFKVSSHSVTVLFVT